MQQADSSDFIEVSLLSLWISFSEDKFAFTSLLVCEVNSPFSVPGFFAVCTGVVFLAAAVADVGGLASVCADVLGLSEVLAGVPSVPGLSGFFPGGAAVPGLVWLLVGVPCVESLFTGAAGLAGFLTGVSDFTSDGRFAVELVVGVLPEFD